MIINKKENLPEEKNCKENWLPALLISEEQTAKLIYWKR